MLVINSREFRNNQAQYFDLVDGREHIIIQRGKNKAYRLLPIEKDDYVTHIPSEYLCNPFDISPCGDMFWADKRNVESLDQSLEIAEKNIAEGKITVCDTYEASLNHLESL
jgi:hypothetical protein